MSNLEVASLLRRSFGGVALGLTAAGIYEHRLVGGGIGHNLPQEAPGAFTEAVVDAESWS